MMNRPKKQSTRTFILRCWVESQESDPVWRFRLEQIPEQTQPALMFTDVDALTKYFAELVELSDGPA